MNTTPRGWEHSGEHDASSTRTRHRVLAMLGIDDHRPAKREPRDPEPRRDPEPDREPSTPSQCLQSPPEPEPVPVVVMGERQRRRAEERTQAKRRRRQARRAGKLSTPDTDRLLCWVDVETTGPDETRGAIPRSVSS